MPVSTRPTGTVPMPGQRERALRQGRGAPPVLPSRHEAWPRGGRKGTGRLQEKQTLRVLYRIWGPPNLIKKERERTGEGLREGEISKGKAVAPCPAPRDQLSLGEALRAPPLFKAPVGEAPASRGQGPSGTAWPSSNAAGPCRAGCPALPVGLLRLCGHSMGIRPVPGHGELHACLSGCDRGLCGITV